MSLTCINSMEVGGLFGPKNLRLVGIADCGTYTDCPKTNYNRHLNLNLNLFSYFTFHIIEKHIQTYYTKRIRKLIPVKV